MKHRMHKWHIMQELRKLTFQCRVSHKVENITYSLVISSGFFCGVIDVFWRSWLSAGCVEFFVIEVGERAGRTDHLDGWWGGRTSRASSSGRRKRKIELRSGRNAKGGVGAVLAAFFTRQGFYNKISGHYFPAYCIPWKILTRKRSLLNKAAIFLGASLFLIAIA